MGRASRNRQTWNDRRRIGFTILELLVSLSVISVLVALILPAVQAARETARRLQCQSELRQIGLALHQYENSHGRFPAAWRRSASQSSASGWATAILPYLDQDALFRQINSASEIDSPSLHNLREFNLSLFVCPSDLVTGHFALFAEEGEHESHLAESEVVLTELPAGSYVGVFGSIDPDTLPYQSGDGVFSGEAGVRFSEIQRGSSETLLVGERTASKLPSTWLGFLFAGEDARARVVGFANIGPTHDEADECEFSSRHMDGANFLWVDGHVSSISRTIDPLLYRAMSRRLP